MFWADTMRISRETSFQERGLEIDSRPPLRTSAPVLGETLRGLCLGCGLRCVP